MGIRGGLQLRHAQNAAQPHLGAPYSAVFFLYIYTFSTQLFGRLVRQYTRWTHHATTRERTSRVECPGGLYNELNTCFYLKSRSLPLEGDMSNNPTSCLSHYLYRSAFIAALFNKQDIALIYYCIHLFLYIYVQSWHYATVHFGTANTPGA